MDLFHFLLQRLLPLTLQLIDERIEERKRYFKYRPELKGVRCKFRQELQNSPKNSSNFKITGQIEGKLPPKINRIRVNLIAILFCPKYEQIIWKIKT